MINRYFRFPGGKAKVLSFSYDDGVEQDIRLIDIFRQHGLKGTFNLNSGQFGRQDKHRRMTEEEVKQVYTTDVCEVACHGAHHGTLAILDPAIAALDVLDDRRNLERLFERQIHGLAYANGSVNETVDNICRSAGIWYGRTAKSTKDFYMSENWLHMHPTCSHNNAQLMDLANRFLTMKPVKSPQMFLVWGHAYQFDDQKNWDVIERFADQISGRDDIWYATNSEIFEYVEAYRQMQVSNDGKTYFNPTCRSLFFDYHGRMCEVKPGETFKL
jgi:peptidoglycan/xylan/chitin deacetylase (PgdA/CDA1 family)